MPDAGGWHHSCRFPCAVHVHPLRLAVASTCSILTQASAPHPEAVQRQEVLLATPLDWVLKVKSGEEAGLIGIVSIELGRNG